MLYSISMGVGAMEADSHAQNFTEQQVLCCVAGIVWLVPTSPLFPLPLSPHSLGPVSRFGQPGAAAAAI
jgi:hypothetical protein